MSKDKITDYSTTSASNTDLGGISLLGTASPRVIKSYMPELMAQLADMNAGTPLDDTFTRQDPDDNTKQFREDAVNIPTGTTRVIDAEYVYQIVERGGTPRLITAYVASGTHTFNTATKYFQIVAVGGGGGSGGVDGTGAGNAGGSAGGNSGFYGRTTYLAKGALTTGTVVIGAAGAAGAGTAGAGGDGGDTTWADATNGTLTWKGGKGSAGRTATSNYAYGIPATPSASSASLIGTGPLGTAAATNNLTIAGGAGGSNPWGTGGCPSGVAFNGNVDGVSGTGYGAGASGAASHAVSGNGLGAAGTAGRLEVWEW